MTILGSGLLSGLLLLGAQAEPAAAPDPRSVPSKKLISRTIFSSDLDGNGVSEEVVLINRITGSRDIERTFDVQIGVYGADDALLWSESILETLGGPCYGAELTLVDLEGDGLNELVLTYLAADGPSRWEGRGVVYRWELGRAHRVWSGVLRLDNSRDQEVPPSERTAFRMELDIPKTIGARGRTLFFEKRMTMVAGVSLDAPRALVERFALPRRETAR